MSISEKDISAQFSISYLNDLEFHDPSILEKVQKRSQKALKSQNFAMANYLNCCFFEKRLKESNNLSIEIKKVNPTVGYGVFAKEEISLFSFIGEYLGIVRKRNKATDILNNYIFSYVIGTQVTPWVIDAEKKGNFTRFINHSSQPNLGSDWLISEGIAHVIFYAKRRVRQGEQLTVDYGPQYWLNRPAALDF